MKEINWLNYWNKKNIWTESDLWKKHTEIFFQKTSNIFKNNNFYHKMRFFLTFLFKIPCSIDKNAFLINLLAIF